MKTQEESCVGCKLTPKLKGQKVSHQTRTRCVSKTKHRKNRDQKLLTSDKTPFIKHILRGPMRIGGVEH